MDLNQLSTWVIFVGFTLFGFAFGICIGAYVWYRYTGNVIREAELITLEAGG